MYQAIVFVFVVVLMPDGIYGWFTKGGFRAMLAAFGLAKKTATYPKLELDESVQSDSASA